MKESLTNALCFPETLCIRLQNYWVLCKQSLMGKQNGYESKCKWSVKRKGLQGNATFLWEIARFCDRRPHFFGECRSFKSLLCKHNLADCILAHVAFLWLVSSGCAACFLRLTVVVVEVGLQAVEVVLSVVFVSLIESGAHLLHAEAAVQDSGKR